MVAKIKWTNYVGSPLFEGKTDDGYTFTTTDPFWFNEKMREIFKQIKDDTCPTVLDIRKAAEKISKLKKEEKEMVSTRDFEEQLGDSQSRLALDYVRQQEDDKTKQLKEAGIIDNLGVITPAGVKLVCQILLTEGGVKDKVLSYLNEDKSE